MRGNNRPRVDQGHAGSWSAPQPLGHKGALLVRPVIINQFLIMKKH